MNTAKNRASRSLSRSSLSIRRDSIGSPAEKDPQVEGGGRDVLFRPCNGVVESGDIGDIPPVSAKPFWVEPTKDVSSPPLDNPPEVVAIVNANRITESAMPVDSRTGNSGGGLLKCERRSEASQVRGQAQPDIVPVPMLFFQPIPPLSAHRQCR